MASSFSFPFGSGSLFLSFLLWYALMFSCGIYVFSGGFLLRRNALENVSAPLQDGPPAVFPKAVVLVVDALKYDFAVFNSTLNRESNYENKMPVFDRLIRDGSGLLFEFIADPPTTTMQRLKGLTTGSLPTFIDVSSNFGSYEITEDNLIRQLKANGKRVVFAGDDTWIDLFPQQFTRAYPYSSFDVWDLDTVDTGVRRHLLTELNASSDWDVLIGHTLGVDHAGHKFGPRHPEMARKLRETNDLVERVVEAMPEDCILIVLGDHGMTLSGDHGGDSRDEVSAALFLHSKGLHVQQPDKSRAAVAQVDLVPTLALLLGVPVPFSNLGSVLEDALRAAGVSPLAHVAVNVKQVMRYLSVYQETGGALPQSTFNALEDRFRRFRSLAGQTEAAESDVLEAGYKLLTEARLMCQSVWVEFDVLLMGFGLTLNCLLACFAYVLSRTPRNRLLNSIINFRFVADLYASFVSGTAFGYTFVTSGFLRIASNHVELAIASGACFSICAFGLSLLWRLKYSLADMVKLSVGGKTMAQVGAITAMLFVLFSNSFVVEEASVSAFVSMTLVFGLLAGLRRRDQGGKSRADVLLAVLLLGTVLRFSQMYFRCREEQAAHCEPSEFHKPIGTLPKDATYRAYRQWRFASAMLAALLVVVLPRLLLSSTGSLNGHSLPVSVASYGPAVLGLTLVAFWALQGHELGQHLLSWQQNILAQTVFIGAFVIIGVLLVQPFLLYVDEKKGCEIPNVRDGIQTYFHLMRTTYYQQRLSGKGQRVNVFGLGSALSAPLLVVVVMLNIVTMLVVGDGLALSVLLGLASQAVFVYISGVNRIRTAKKISDLLVVPWESIIGWWLLENLFFYATGHQPTFPSIHWNAAFVGFSGSDYGAKETSSLNALLPLVLVGWNTYCARILFGLTLPFLFLGPICLCLLRPELRADLKAVDESSFPEENALSASSSDLAEDLDRGEVLLLERPEETLSQVLMLVSKYLALQSVRYLGTALAATILRRHLMVWKIFAPRFIFESAGFVVSALSVILGYAVVVRILSATSRYYKRLDNLSAAV